MDFLNYFKRDRFAPSTYEIGIGGFSAYALVSQSVNYKASAPSAVVEDGSFINDHIINDPETISIEGVVGDVYRRNATILNRVSPLSNTLGQITLYAPRLTAFQSQVVSGLQNTFGAAINAVNGFLQGGNPLNAVVGNLDNAAKTLQEQFIDAIENIYYGKQLIPIDVGGRRFDNMVVTLAQFARSNVDNAITFKIEAQRFRMAQTTFVEVGKVPRADKNPSSALGGQTNDAKQVGAQTGQKRPQSFLSKRIAGFGGGS